MKKLILTMMITLMTLSMPAWAAPASVYVDVNGLVCDFCARALEKVFGKQETVQDIAVDLDAKVVTINFKEGEDILGDDVIEKLITDSGYNVEGIRHE